MTTAVAAGITAWINIIGVKLSPNKPCSKDTVITSSGLYQGWKGGLVNISPMFWNVILGKPKYSVSVIEIKNSDLSNPNVEKRLRNIDIGIIISEYRLTDSLNDEDCPVVANHDA